MEDDPASGNGRALAQAKPPFLANQEHRGGSRGPERTRLPRPKSQSLGNPASVAAALASVAAGLSGAGRSLPGSTVSRRLGSWKFGRPDKSDCCKRSCFFPGILLRTARIVAPDAGTRRFLRRRPLPLWDRFRFAGVMGRQKCRSEASRGHRSRGGRSRSGRWNRGQCSGSELFERGAKGSPPHLKGACPLPPVAQQHVAGGGVERRRVPSQGPRQVGLGVGHGQGRLRPGPRRPAAPQVPHG